MTLSGEVTKLESTGDGVLVTLQNVRAKTWASWGSWEPYGPSISFRIFTGAVKSYPVGRIIKITLKPK